MNKVKEFIAEKALPRRSFLKVAGLSSVGLSLGFPLKTRWAQAGESQDKKLTANWHTDANGNKYFNQKNLLTDWLDQNYILARYEGWWWAYNVRSFDNDFHDWWIEEKSWYYEQLLAFFEGETKELKIPNGGHHHPMLTTYGSRRFNRGNRGDSEFHLNCAPKGFTMIPKADTIDYVLGEIDKVYADPNTKLPVDLFKKRRELYQNKTLWDTTRFATLELYSGRPINDNDTGEEGSSVQLDFQETHTFQNIMANPMSTLTYMSLYTTDGTQSYFGGDAPLIPTFEFRGFSWLISYYNPAITPYEKKVADYINQAHCRYHGGACDIATNIFIIVEEFNNTPTYDPGRGKRVVPPFPYRTPESSMNASMVAPKKTLTNAEKLELLKKMRIPV